MRRLLLITCRTMLSVTLLFSGFVKGIDPEGTQYKLSEYCEAMGIGGALPDKLLLTAAIALAVMEFMLGVLLALGAKRRLTTCAIVLLFAVMTPLALWLWIANPVSDCGCFGDALHVSNGATFAKNILFLAAALLLLRYHRQLTPLQPKAVRMLIADLSVLYIAAIAYTGATRLPLIDFRPFHIGADIAAGMSVPEGEEPQFETTFVLEKDGKQQEFTLDDYPDSTWTFVDSRTRQVKAGSQPPITNFSVERIDTREDITKQLLQHRPATLLLIAYDLDKAHQENYADINRLHAYAKRQRIPFYCLTASTGEQIKAWQKRTGADYIFCHTDATTLKTMIRSNPGLMLLHDGKVQAKWSNRSLPGITADKMLTTIQPTPGRQTALIAGGYLLLMMLIAATAYLKTHNKKT